ncbi:MAG: response regulator transcription factor [Aquincola sp.]|nr:response regulator transcription factor [Aquincola sp.]MDH5329145.1 response regulator transcription factor [Aquincola sp.]
MSATHLAVLDDEIDITQLIARYLGAVGFRVTQLHRGADLLALMQHDPPALVLLDLGLPDEDGFAIARQLREHHRCGLVIVSGRGDAVDKVVGLEVGADDYVTKPFDLRELLARVKAVLRRMEGGAAATAGPAGNGAVASVVTGRERWGFADFEIDVAARTLSHAQRGEITLTAGEFDLLVTFCRHAGRVLSRDFLLDATRGREAGPFDRTIDVQVGRIRRKLEADPENPSLIKSVRGAGYLLAVGVEPR